MAILRSLRILKIGQVAAVETTGLAQALPKLLSLEALLVITHSDGEDEGPEGLNSATLIMWRLLDQLITARDSEATYKPEHEKKSWLPSGLKSLTLMRSGDG